MAKIYTVGFSGLFCSILRDNWSVINGPYTYKDRELCAHLSHEKNPPTFHYTGWLIGILIMVYYNPYITG